MIESTGLGVSAATAISLTQNNRVSNLAGNAETQFQFVNQGTFNVATISADGRSVTGISAGAISLFSQQGAINETTGVIKADLLNLRAVSFSSLTGNNQVQQVSAQITGSGQGIDFNNQGNLLIVGSGINAGNGTGSADLSSLANISQAPGAIVNAANLTVTSPGTVLLDSNNQVQQFFATGGYGNQITFNAIGNLQLGTIGNVGTLSVTASGRISSADLS
jgi:hypothetical protein